VLKCSFCGAQQGDVPKLIAGPGVYICSACIAIARRVIDDGEAPGARVELTLAGRSANLKCSFCGKDPRAVSGLLRGPGVSICNECIALCEEIIGEEMPG